jgi:hypothetical protein
MDRLMATRVLKRPKRLRGLLVLVSAAALAYVAATAGLSNASAESPSCTLTAPAKIPVDKPYLQFDGTRACTAGAPTEVTWTASIGAKPTGELWFLQRTTTLSDVYSDDPMGLWTWKVTEPVDRPDVVFNEPTTDVRLKSVATGTGVWNAADQTTKVSFHVTRYDPATDKMVPWAGAVGTTEYHQSPLIGDPPFTPGTAYTANSNGDIAFTAKGSTFDRVVRIVFPDVPNTFGSRSGLVLIRAARVMPTK